MGFVILPFAAWVAIVLFGCEQAVAHRGSSSQRHGLQKAMGHLPPLLFGRFLLFSLLRWLRSQAIVTQTIYAGFAESGFGTEKHGEKLHYRAVSFPV